MIKTRRIVAVLMTLALIASSAVLAHAGAGSGSGVNATLFNCYVIEDGTDFPFVLALTDQFGTREHVRVGKARLLCTPTTAATVEHGPVLNSEFTAEVAAAVDHLKCYRASFRHDHGLRAVATIIDPLVTEAVELGRLRFLCTPAVKVLAE